MKYSLLLFALIVTLNSQIKFDADFESGNIKSVSTTDSVNYSVTTISDIGGRWFYFRITGVEDKFIKVSIPTTDFSRAMYSYNNKDYHRFTAEETPSYASFQKTFEKDTVYVSYYTPYNYSYLQERIDEWKNNSLVVYSELGRTDRDFPIQELKITDPFVPDNEKYKVWIHARTHPSETPSSWQFEGIVETLLKDDPEIDYYRKNIVFYLIPFTNPEGVYYGRSRTNFDGVDIESNWNKSDDETTTEVKILKQRMLELSAIDTFDVFLNLHSQAASFCTFWIHEWTTTSDYFYRREYQFANLHTSDNPYFSDNDYSESTLKPWFPEGWLWNLYGDKVMALTYETPYDQYSNDDWVTNDNLKEIGERIVYATAEYLELSHPEHIILDNKNAVVNGNWTSINQNSLEFFGDDFLFKIPGDGNSSVTFSTQILDTGVYNIYSMWPSNSGNAFDAKFKINAGNEEIELTKTLKENGGQWNYLASISLKEESNISITLNDNASGNIVADAFRIIKSGDVTSVKEKYLPNDFVLYQNYPNPFNPTTKIKFELNTPGNTTLKIYDVLGKEVAVLVNDYLSSGTHEINFDASSLASGMYLYKIQVGNKWNARKMILVK